MTNSGSTKKYKVVMSCSAGYIFHEIFKPLIEGNSFHWDIILILRDVNTPKYVIKTIKRLLFEKIQIQKPQEASGPKQNHHPGRFVRGHFGGFGGFNWSVFPLLRS